MRPFLAGNGYLVAGVAMVVVGSSLLAYYTWDKHWLLRYTLMPALLGTFTAALAAAGSWIERRNPQLRPTAAVLRGAAVGLLPVNFMAVALLARDPQVTARGPAVVLLGTLYLLLAGWGLRRWCAAVHPSLGGLLGGALLGLNALVMVAPAALTLAPATAVRLPVVAAVGFYAGFALLAIAALRFARLKIDDPPVLGFFGATLAVTFLQVFAWVHVTLQRLPMPEVYAALVVLAGGLVLHLERGGADGRPRPESFLGFALVLLGLLMGVGHPDVRIAVLLIAGAVWLYQAPRRRHPAHA